MVKGTSVPPDAVVLEGPESGGHQGFSHDGCLYSLRFRARGMVCLSDPYRLPARVYHIW